MGEVLPKYLAVMVRVIFAKGRGRPEVTAVVDDEKSMKGLK